MKEVDVRRRFVEHLVGEGWSVREMPQGNFPDVDAQRSGTGARLIAEVKGHTKEPGLDTDTGYGQLLRRMGTEPGTRYALVVPEAIRSKAERVPRHVRDLLRVELWLVPDIGAPYQV